MPTRVIRISRDCPFCLPDPDLEPAFVIPAMAGTHEIQPQNRVQDNLIFANAGMNVFHDRN